MLCAEDKGDFKVACETFIETKLKRSVNWINDSSGLKDIEKSLLLCRLQTRAPEDVECAFKKLGIKSKI